MKGNSTNHSPSPGNNPQSTSGQVQGVNAGSGSNNFQSMSVQQNPGQSRSLQAGKHSGQHGSTYGTHHQYSQGQRAGSGVGANAGNGSPSGSHGAQNQFSNSQKINGGRIRARNPVLMSMQNSGHTVGTGQDFMNGANRSGSGGQTSHPHAPNVLMPLSNRSLSPASYQQLQSAVHQQKQIGSPTAGDKNLILGNFTSNNMAGNQGTGQGAIPSRKPGSLGRKILGSGGLINNEQGKHTIGGQSRGGAGHHRGASIGGIGSHQGANGFTTLSPTNYHQRDRGSSHQGKDGSGLAASGFHNFHPSPHDQNTVTQSTKNSAGHSIIHGSTHFHQLNNMRGDRDNGASQQRNYVGNSLDSVNLMQSNDSMGGISSKQANQQNMPSSAGQQNTVPGQDGGRGGSPPPGPQSHHQVHQVVQLNKKILGNRKRNQGPGSHARDKSYDSYNQKLQLPPMIKTPHDRSDRTYSVPSAGANYQGGSGQQANQHGQMGSNGMMQGHHHQYMLPLSPQANGASSGANQAGASLTHQMFSGAGSSITPKTTTHAQMHQRQSINEGLMNASGSGDRDRHHSGIGGMISGQSQQNNNAGGQGNGSSQGNNVSQSINGNQMFTRFSNIQLQSSLNKNAKMSSSGGRAFQSVNNFFNPRTAGAQKHPTRERISTHHFQANDIMSPHSHANVSGNHPLSPNSGGGSYGGQNSRVGGGSYQADNMHNRSSDQGGSIFLKNAFSPRMKLGQPPGSSGLASQFNGSSGNSQSPTSQNHTNSNNNQHQYMKSPGQSQSMQNSSPQGNLSHNQPQGSPQAKSKSSGAAAGAAGRSRSRPRNNTGSNSHNPGSTGANSGSMQDTRSVGSPQTESLEIQSQGASKSTQDSDDQRYKIPTPLSSEEHRDSNIQFVEVQTLLFGENPAPLNPKTIQLKNHEPTKASQKKCGIIKSYAANTNQGIIRDYNEDRVSIILNILKPKNKINLDIEWPQICFFGVFDGHGGSACADYLRDNLHNFVVQNDQFPQNPVEAIKEGFRECERNFLSLVEQAQARAQHLMTGQTVGPERSGSCATVVMVIDEMIYVINVGDSRAIMSIDGGEQIGVLSRDHKPDDELEKIRIQAAGGKIYRTQTFAKAATHPGEKDLYVQGPLRVFPGRLSVSKTFGDIEAKRPRYGGNPNVIVCEPDIKCFKVQDNFDFIMIGCDGIFERLSNRDCVDAIWDRITEQINISNKMGGGEGSYKGGKRDGDKKRAAANGTGQGNQSNANSANRKQLKTGMAGASQYNEHQAAADGVEIVIRCAAASRSLDNITSLILGLKGLKRTIQKLNAGQELSSIRQELFVQSQGMKNTYLEDFAFLEVAEPETGLISDAITIAHGSADDKPSQKKMQQTSSPTNNSSKQNQLSSPGGQKGASNNNSQQAASVAQGPA